MDITVKLTNEVTKIELSGGEHVRVKNIGDSTVYISKTPDVAQGVNGTISVQVGGMDGITNVCRYQIKDDIADYYGTIYATSDGDGTAEIRTQDTQNFRYLVKGGEEKSDTSVHSKDFIGILNHAILGYIGNIEE